MIFITGVHGVGKTYICRQLAQDIIVYSASKLIEQYVQIRYNGYKKAYDLDDNQNYLIYAVNQKENEGEKFILDGHFCLFNANGDIERISYEVFNKLNIEGIILLWSEEETIQKRIQQREKKSEILSLYEIFELQKQEMEYAKEVALKLNIPLILIDTNAETTVPKCKQFIAELWKSYREKCM